MKTNWIKQILLAGLALVGLMAGQAVFAQQYQSATLTVSASIPKACRFQVNTASLNIEHAATSPDIDPAATVAASGSSNIAYRCQTGVLPQFDIGGTGTFSDPKGPVTVTLTGPGSMDAGITVTGGGAGTGLGTGQDINATISGTIAVAQFQAAPVGSYSATVTIDISAQ